MLTSEQMERFERDGALVVPGAIDAEAVARVRRAYERRLDDIIARAVRLGQMDAPASRRRLAKNSPRYFAPRRNTISIWIFRCQ